MNNKHDHEVLPPSDNLRKFELGCSNVQRMKYFILSVPNINRLRKTALFYLSVRIGDTVAPDGGGGGQIFYHPDEADDWDEEDPDDDLDI